MRSLLLATMAVSGGLAHTQVTPGPNVALGRTYTLEPLPTYGDCADAGDATQLTDGAYTEGYFWVMPSTVGWVHSRPVAVTIDLGQVEPIAGLSYSTAAGVADVTWPRSILLMVSDDGQTWTEAGDLIALANKNGAPPPTPYQTHRFVSHELRTRGRFVALVIDCIPYTVVDEIEVYRGVDEWLTQPLEGRQVTEPPLQYRRNRQVLDSAQYRMRTDLSSIVDAAQEAELAEREGTDFEARAAALRIRIDALEALPEGFTTVLPLNELHAEVYALNAALLRARGYQGVAVWSSYRYDPLQPLEAPDPPPDGLPSFRVRLMRNEHRAEVLNLTNATDESQTVTVQTAARGVQLREVIFTDTRERQPVAAALGPGTSELQTRVPAGTTRQVWIEVDSRDLPAGDYEAEVTVRAGGLTAAVPLQVHVADLDMPEEFSVAIGGWDETNGAGGYDVTAENMAPLIRNLREHGVNMPWSNPQVLPSAGEYDTEGNLAAPPDFTAWDEWVSRWPGARHWGVFANVGASFAGGAMGTPRFDRMVGAWATAWVEHATEQGIAPQQIKVLLVDEARAEEHDRIITAWAKAMHAAQPELVIWNDPIHPDPSAVDPEFYTQSDVLCLNATLFLQRGQAYQGFFEARQQAGAELWFYSCSGPAKWLDPAAYWRGQFWLNLKHRGRGSCYWAFGDEAGNSWNAYAQARPAYSPLFLSPTVVTDAKPMEAIREGAQDYEYFALLRERVEALEGSPSAALTEAQTLLTTGPEQAVAIMGPDKQPWSVPKDREVLDRLRLKALELLEQLAPTR